MLVKTPYGELHSWEEVIEFCKQHPEFIEPFKQNLMHFADVWRTYEATQAYERGEASANDILGSIGGNGIGITPEAEKYLDNLISRENTANDQAYQREMRDTSLTSAGQQLSSLGLSTSNVIQTGGSSSGVSSSAAGVDMHSAAGLHQQERINRFNQRMSIAKSLIGAAGSMASSGIYGAALGAIKNAASKVATSAAHSGRVAFTPHKSSPKDDAIWDEAFKGLGS